MNKAGMQVGLITTQTQDQKPTLEKVLQAVEDLYGKFDTIFLAKKTAEGVKDLRLAAWGEAAKSYSHGGRVEFWWTGLGHPDYIIVDANRGKYSVTWFDRSVVKSKPYEDLTTEDMKSLARR